MNPHAEALKRAAIQACSLKRFPFPKFMGERGLEAILIDADENNESAKDLVVRVLVECCVTDGKFNNFEVGLLSVILFLSNRFGEPHQGHLQQFRDLLSILNHGGSEPAIRSWLESYYP